MISFHARSGPGRPALSPTTPELLYQTVYKTKIAFSGKLFTDTKHKTFYAFVATPKTIRMTLVGNKEFCPIVH